MTYADLDAASIVVLAGLEPEDEAGTIFLRLRKAGRKGRTRVVSVAPYASRGLLKLDGTWSRPRPATSRRPSGPGRPRRRRPGRARP